MPASLHSKQKQIAYNLQANLNKKPVEYRKKTSRIKSGTNQNQIQITNKMQTKYKRITDRKVKTVFARKTKLQQHYHIAHTASKT
jgi:hypothetical protein